MVHQTNPEVPKVPYAGFCVVTNGEILFRKKNEEVIWQTSLVAKNVRMAEESADISGAFYGAKNWDLKSCHYSLVLTQIRDSDLWDSI